MTEQDRAGQNDTRAGRGRHSNAGLRSEGAAWRVRRPVMNGEGDRSADDTGRCDQNRFPICRSPTFRPKICRPKKYRREIRRREICHPSKRRTQRSLRSIHTPAGRPRDLWCFRRTLAGDKTRPNSEPAADPTIRAFEELFALKDVKAVIAPGYGALTQKTEFRKRAEDLATRWIVNRLAVPTVVLPPSAEVQP